MELEPNQITERRSKDNYWQTEKNLQKRWTQKYNALEAFETYKSQPNLRDFLTEFEKRYHKTKSYETTISDKVLAHRLLKAANLLTCDEQLVKATITELKRS